MREIVKLNRTMQRPVKRKRVAAYTRVSTVKETMHHSLSAQISYYNRYIGSRGDWEFAGIYADEGMTGTRSNRPEFVRLLEDCRAGKIDMVITKSVTRLARNTLTLLETTRELKALEIDIYFEKENIHTLSADGEFILTILALFAQEESRSASENVKWRIRKKFEKGIPTYTDLYGYCFKEGTFYIVPEEAEVVKQIYADFLSGMGKYAIAKKLNRQGIQTKKHSLWREITIRDILTNEKYTGDLLLQKTFRQDHISKKTLKNHGEYPMYAIENNHEAIIDKAVFADVQKEIKRRKEKIKPIKLPTEPHLFTGLLCCGLCGKHFHRKIVSHGKNTPQKTIWKCATFLLHGKDACPAKQIAESILIQKTSEVLGTDDWDWKTLMERFREIQVPEHNHLVYVFRDGHTEDIYWQNPSRRESWTPGMKERARQRQLAIIERRKQK